MKRIPLFRSTALVVLLVVGYLNSGYGTTTTPHSTDVLVPSTGSLTDASSPITAIAENSTAIPVKHKVYQVASLKWDDVRAPFLICSWLLAAIIVKTIFHQWHFLTRLVPDSSLLLLFGIILGLAIYYIEDEHDEGILDAFSDAFFIYILPPIVFDAGYFMPNRSFFDNLGTILVYAVIGTIFNAMTIGFTLWGIGLRNVFTMKVGLLPVLTFSSIISAVDPVAVLVVFEDIHVNAMLYIVVFGESLLNDAVSVVLYEMFVSFSEIGSSNVTSLDIGLGIVSFFVVSLGGVGIGILYAFVCSLMTRFTTNVRIVEPLLVLLMGYMAYMTAQMFDLSGILAIVFCGITMRQYVESNIDNKSKVSLQYMLRMLCTTSETIVFLFLGISAIRKSTWDPWFIVLTILFCLVYRIIGTVVQTWVVNKFRLNKLLTVDQTIMAYGGLRGAIAYGLVASLDDNIIPEKSIFLPAAISVILFTVFFQGMTIKPIVNFLDVKKQHEKEPAIGALIFEKSVDDLVSAIEAVAGRRGHHWLRNKFIHINNNWIKPMLVNGYDPEVSGWRGDHIKRVFQEINLRAALQHIEKTGSWGLMPLLQQEEKSLQGEKTDSPFETTPSIIVSSDEDNEFYYYAGDDNDDDEDITAETRAELLDRLHRGNRLSRDILSDPRPMPAKRGAARYVSRSSSIWSGRSAVSSKEKRHAIRRQSSPRIGNRLKTRAANEMLAGALHQAGMYGPYLAPPSSAVSFHSHHTSRQASVAALPAGLLTKRRQTIAHAREDKFTWDDLAESQSKVVRVAPVPDLRKAVEEYSVSEAKRTKSLDQKRRSAIPKIRVSHSDTDRDRILPIRQKPSASVGWQVSHEGSISGESPLPSPFVASSNDYGEAYSAMLALRRRHSSVFATEQPPVSPPSRFSMPHEQLETVTEAKSSITGGSSTETTPRTSDDTVLMVDPEPSKTVSSKKKALPPLEMPDSSELGMEYFYRQEAQAPREGGQPQELLAENLGHYLAVPAVSVSPTNPRIGAERQPNHDGESDKKDEENRTFRL